MKKRAQAAIEYLLVGTMVSFIIIPTLYIFYAYSHTSNEEIRQSQLNKVGADIVSIAEQVYYLGEPSKVTIDATMPEGIVGIEVWKNQELVFFLNDGSEVSFMSKVNITTNQHCYGTRCQGNFTKRFHSPGLKSIIIEAKNGHVFIREAGDNQTDQPDIEKKAVYCDGDEDSYFSMHGLEFCPPGVLSSPEPGSDCDDANPLVNPGADEECDGVDNNCDGQVDEGFTNETCSYVCKKNNYKWVGNGEPLNCCGNDLGEANPYQATEQNCFDGNDNDCNGLTDCEDPECEEDPACIECECSSGPCCDGCYYKASGSQPTGFTDDTDGFCTGTNGPTSTSYVYTRDYSCNGIDANEHHIDTLRDTCGTCKYCTDNDLTCNYYSSSTQCSALQDCDYLNYYHITGTQSATSTSYCKYADYDDNYRYCDGAGSCSSLTCPLGSDTITATAGTCKYISGCSGSTPGTVSNYAAGTSCGTNLKCDGNGNCVSACVCSSGPCCDGCYYKPAGTACGTKDCDYLNYYYTSGTDSCTSTSYCKYRDYYDQTRYCDSSGNCGDPSCSSYYDYTRATCGTCKLIGYCSSSSQTCRNCPDGASCGSCSWCSAGACKTCRWVQYGTMSLRVSSWGDYHQCNIYEQGTTAFGTDGAGYSCGTSLPHVAYQSILYQLKTWGTFKCTCS